MVRGVLTWLASWMFSAAAVITTMYVLYVGSSYLASVPTGCCAVQCIISHVYDIIYKPGTTYLLPLVICTGIPRVYCSSSYYPALCGIMSPPRAQGSQAAPCSAVL